MPALIPDPHAALVAAALAAVALLYSSVGHGGASGYLAVLALFGTPPAVMKPTALVLNLVVASIATLRFARAGHFDGRTFWPFAVASVPLAFVGGALHLPVAQYKAIVGVVLLFAAWRLWAVGASAGAAPAGPASADPASGEGGARRDPPVLNALVLGAAMGFLSGLTGVGGGIFLSPLLLLLGWATPQRTAAVSAAFILVNSAAGLAGHTASLASVPGDAWWWAGAVAVAGAVGSGVGSRRLPPAMLRRLLAVVLVIAGAKLLLGG